MGLKTENYKSEKLGIVLPTAYAVVHSLRIIGDRGYATINVQTTRDSAINKDPIESYDIQFKVNRLENPFTTAYNKIKGQDKYEMLDELTEKSKTVVENMPLYGWVDDIESDNKFL
nr:MAG TPA: hypothetical protein [Caudoviricetes sp.]